MDYPEKLRQCLREYHDAEHGVITTNPTLAEIDTENYSDSCKWLRLPIVDEQPETVANMILSGVEQFPNDCLAGLLAEVLKNKVPRGIDLQGMCIDRTESVLRFCISGSTSIEALRNLCGQFERNHEFEDGK